MQKYIIIRGAAGGGKTTTAGFVYEKLTEKSPHKWLFNGDFKEQTSLLYSDKGDILDFIAFILLESKLIIIISHGDFAFIVKELLDKLGDTLFVEALIGKWDYSLVIFVCCARSIDRPGSVYRMLKERANETDREEFWTKKSEDADKKKIKEDVISSIIQSINKW